MGIKPTESDKKKAKETITSIAGILGLKLLNPKDILSRHNYNKYVYEYDSFFSDTPLEIIIETSFYQKVYPVEIHMVKSIVGEFCKYRGMRLPVPFEAAEVNMSLQSLERTFIDKIFAICDYRIQDMQDRDSRHLYDIAKLAPYVELSAELAQLVDKVRIDRMKSKNNPSAQPEYDIPQMLNEIVESRFYEADYNNITRKLLYEDVPYEEAVESGIAIVARSDVFEYRT